MSSGAESGFERFNLERTNALSDGVFAIALTLLVLDIKLPHGTTNVTVAADLLGLIPQIQAYALSFAVLGLMWVRHHGFFHEVSTLDRSLTWLNLLYLGLVAFVPFPTGVLATHEAPASVALYAGTIALSSAVFSFSYTHARRKGLLVPEARRRDLIDLVATPLVFTLSIPLAFLTAGGAEMFWISLVLIGALSGRRRS
ncbi:MAG: potassium channel family protein [Thermoleophilaceae bacterium]|nr:potassium channel family protein [Thermoleophilaceae bacterium]